MTLDRPHRQPRRSCEPYLYLICRGDLPGLSHLIVQLLHAAHTFGALYQWGAGIPNIVLLSPVADRQELDRVALSVKVAQLPHYVYSEPHDNWGITALIALARTYEERAVFKSFQMWKFDSPVAQPQSDRTLNPGGVGASPTGGANSTICLTRDTSTE